MSGNPVPAIETFDIQAVSAGIRALTTGTIQTAYPCGSRTFEIIWLK
jgi:hypothetical protein